MKKLTPFALALLILVAIIAPVSADQHVDNLTGLAQYAPADAPFFAAMRTDEAMIDELNTLVNSTVTRFNERVGRASTPIDLRDMLNEAYNNSEDGSYQDDIRSWLGDYAAVFLPSMDGVMSGSSTPVTAVLEVTDFNAAVAFFDKIYGFDIEFGDMEKTEQDNGSVFYEAQVSWASDTLVTPDRVFVGDVEGAVMPGEDARKLSSLPEFGEVMNALPAQEGYNGVVYINPAPVIELAAAFGPMLMGEAWPGIDVDALAECIGQQALGFTVLQDRTLVMDYAQNGTFDLGGDPLDLAWMDRVPADAVLVAESSGLGTSIRQMLDLLYSLNDMLTEMDVLPAEQLGPLSFLGPDDIATFFTLMVEGTYNIDLDETLAWMDGDHVMFMQPNITDDLMTSGIDTGFLLTTDNPEATAALIEKVAELTMRQYGPATYEDGTLTVPLGAIIGMPELGAMTVTSNDEFLAAGTQATVAAMLNPTDPITASDAYAFESSLFLDNPTLLLYLNGGAVRDAASQLVAKADGVDEEMAVMLDAALSIVDSAAVTVSHDNGITRARFTITLGE